MNVKLRMYNEKVIRLQKIIILFGPLLIILLYILGFFIPETTLLLITKYYAGSLLLIEGLLVSATGLAFGRGIESNVLKGIPARILGILLIGFSLYIFNSNIA